MIINGRREMLFLFLAALTGMRDFSNGGCRECSAKEFVMESECHNTGFISGGSRGSVHFSCVPVLTDTFLTGIQFVLVLGFTFVNVFLLYQIRKTCIRVR
jgi:hypothetical protein